MWSISPKLWRQRTRLQEKHHGEKVKGRQHLLPSRTVSYTGIFDQCLLRVLFVGPQFDKSFEEQCLCQFGGLNKSCSVETLENDNYSRQSVFDTLCHRNYHNKSWFSKGRETNRQSRFDAWYRMLRAGALGWPRGMVWGGRWEGGSGWGTCVHPWRIHVEVWQNQYNSIK